jgi:SAM-dependent methyltransferase
LRILNLLRRLSFILWYYRRPPWDSGIVPPEVREYIQSHPAGRALDLGCGSGTSSIALAHAGWSVTGVDFVPRAIRQARLKAQAAGLRIDFRLGDVTRLGSGPAQYDLVLDIGCFHGLSRVGKKSYLNQLENLLASDGIWLLYGFFKLREAPGPGLVPDDISRVHGRLHLLNRQDGEDRIGRPSAWFWFQG